MSTTLTRGTTERSVPTERSELWRAYKAALGNVSLRNALVEIYLPLVKYNAERIWARLPDSVELDDLVSAGVFGLMDALRCFSLERGIKFETYCVPRIRGAMLDELRNVDWVPRLVRARASKLQAAADELSARYFREPTEDEMTMHLGISIAEYEALRKEASATQVSSLHGRWDPEAEFDGSGYRLIDIVESKREATPDAAEARRQFWQQMLTGFKQDERWVILMYYVEDMRMREIAEMLQVSESRVSQLHSAIIYRMKRIEARRYRLRDWVSPLARAC